MSLRLLIAALGAVLRLASAGPALAEAPDSAATDEFAPTTDPPWNPARPAPAREGWETILTLPGRIATLPLSALGIVTRNTLLAVEENAVVPKVVYALAAPARHGIFITPASLGDRTGLGIAVRVSPPPTRRLVEAGWSGSTGQYSRTLVGLGVPAARIEYEQAWRPHDRMFGIGLATAADRPGAYSVARRSLRLRADLALGRTPFARDARHRLSASADNRELRIGHPQNEPDGAGLDTTVAAVAAALDRDWKGIVYDVALEADHRAGIPHWSRGFRVRAAFQHGRPEAQPATLDASRRFATFQRYTLEAEGGVSFLRDPRTVRLLLRGTVLEVPDADATLIAAPDLARLGGSRGLAGFEPGRFHDDDALLGRLSYIFPLAQHYELDLHAEAGGVYGDLWRHPTRAGVATSYGVSLRPRTHVAPLGEIGLDWSREGVRFGFSIGGVE